MKIMLWLLTTSPSRKNKSAAAPERFFAGGGLILRHAAAEQAQTIRVSPSAFCPLTDGAFTNCMPGMEAWKEWHAAWA
jgi:hypothetical protein